MAGNACVWGVESEHYFLERSRGMAAFRSVRFSPHFAKICHADKYELPPQVVLKWRFDWAGPPHGLVERLIASCRVIGEVEHGLCWRYGAAFKSHIIVEGVGETFRLRCFVYLFLAEARGCRG